MEPKQKFKNISKTILELCPKYMGYPTPNRLNGILPKLSIYNNNDSDCCGYFDSSELTIRVYSKLIRSKLDHIRTIIHEYTHYVQMYDSSRLNSKYSKFNDSLGYQDNPFEVEARKNEIKYMRLIYRKVKHLF